MEKAKVYLTKTITPESLVKIYEALGRELHGKVAIGVASAFGKGHIHCNGQPCTKFEDLFTADHDSFLGSMADADSAVIDYMGTREYELIALD